MNAKFIGILLIGFTIYLSVTVGVILLLRSRLVERHLGIFYWTRYSLLIGTFLIAFPVFGNWFARSVLYGLLVLEHVEGWDVIWKFAFVTWASFMAALMVISSYRVISHNADARFVVRQDEPAPPRDQPPPKEVWTVGDYALNRWAVLLVLGLWIPAWCGLATYHEYASAELSAESAVRTESPGAATAATTSAADVAVKAFYGALLGFLVVVLTLFVMGRLQHLLFSDAVGRIGLVPFEAEASASPGAASWLLERALRNLGPGYTYIPDTADEGGLRAGHPQLVLLVAVLLFQYLLFYWITWAFNLIPTDGAPMSALFFLLTITALIGFILTGLSFYLDYYRVPTLLFMLLVVLIPHVALKTTHFFELNPQDDDRVRGLTASAAQRQPFQVKEYNRELTLDSALSEWRFPEQPQEPGGTLVVVAAAGGGIQAAAWTAHVLTGLDEALEGFGDSIGLISGVSGGSVGSMYYLQQRNDRSNDPSRPSEIAPERVEQIRRMAEASSLEATAWGVAFPDLIRLFFPPAVHDRYDRGWSLELDWRKRLGSRTEPNDTRFSDWAEKVRRGQMAITAFNAALADIGSAMILSPVVDNGNHSSQLQLLNFYPHLKPNPRITTAARLSATFSYVSPICKPLPDDLPPELRSDGRSHLNHRIADGGYVDNSGLLTATRWTKKLIEANWKNPRGLQFRNVIFLRILPFPEVPESDEVSRSDRMGLLWETMGPILALNSARGMVQATRGDWELELIAQAMRDHEETAIRRNVAAPKLDKVREEVTAQKGSSADKLHALHARAASSRQESVERLLQQAQIEIRDDAALSERAKSHALASLEIGSDELSRYRTPIYTVTMQPRYDKNLASPPLSWKLAPSEKQMIRNAWAETAKQIQEASASQPLTTDQPLKPEDLKRFFRFRTRSSL